MGGSRKLQRDFVRADIAAVNALLAQLDDEDVMSRFGLDRGLKNFRRQFRTSTVCPLRPMHLRHFILAAVLSSADGVSRVSSPAKP
jgi:hypothetical protein